MTVSEWGFQGIEPRLTSSVEPAEQYLKTFHWNKVKYRADKPLGETIDTLRKVSLVVIFESLNLYADPAALRKSPASITTSKISIISTTKSRLP